MKKSSKILGSIALSAALVMGTATPAFAVVHDGETQYSDPAKELEGNTYTPDVNLTNNMTTFNSENTSEAEGSSTVVKASTYTSQLNVTIPLVLPLMFDTVGGTGMAPRDDAYYIKNNSATPITVTKAVYKMADSAKWGFGNDVFADGTTATSTKAIGDVYVKLTPTATPEADTPTEKLPNALELKNRSGAAVNATTGEITQDNLKWGIKAKDAVSGDSYTYGLQIEPSSSILKQSVPDPTKLAFITYTVAVGAEAPAGAPSLPGTMEPGKVPANNTEAYVSAIKNLFTAVSDKAGFVDIVAATGVTDPITDASYVKIESIEKYMTMSNHGPVDGSLNTPIDAGAMSYVITVSPATPPAQGDTEGDTTTD